MTKPIPDPRVEPYELGRDGEEDSWVDHVLVGIGNSPSRTAEAWCGVSGKMLQVSTSQVPLLLVRPMRCDECVMAIHEARREVQGSDVVESPVLDNQDLLRALEVFLLDMVQQGQLHHDEESGFTIRDGTQVRIRLAASDKTWAECWTCGGRGQVPRISSLDCTVCGESVNLTKAYMRSGQHGVRHVMGSPLCAREFMTKPC